jgi:hypothetical protein
VWDKVTQFKPHPKSQVQIKFEDLDTDKTVVEKIFWPQLASKAES